VHQSSVLGKILLAFRKIAAIRNDDSKKVTGEKIHQNLGYFDHIKLRGGTSQIDE